MYFEFRTLALKLIYNSPSAVREHILDRTLLNEGRMIDFLVAGKFWTKYIARSVDSYLFLSPIAVAPIYSLLF